MKPQVWGEIIRPALTDREGWALFIGTPKGTNLFSKTLLRRAPGPGVVRRPAPRIGHERDLARGTRARPPGDDRAQYAQEMDCDFAAAVDNVLIPFQVVLDATKRDILNQYYAQDAKILGRGRRAVRGRPVRRLPAAGQEGRHAHGLARPRPDDARQPGRRA